VLWGELGAVCPVPMVTLYISDGDNLGKMGHDTWDNGQEAQAAGLWTAS
jgi:hypothetical protein